MKKVEYFPKGQAQRTAIVCAVLKDAPILLLDESTSFLEVTTKLNVFRDIVHKRPNKTCVETTLRPSVLNICKRIYCVLETAVTELNEEESVKMAIDF